MIFNFDPYIANIGYGANVNSQALAGFNSFSSTAMIDLYARRILVSQSRQLVISNGVAAAGIDRYVCGVVGSGISYIAPERSSLIPDIYPLISDSFSRAFAFASKTCELDAQKRLTFSQLQTLALESMMLSGEVFFVRKPDSVSWTAIEADRVMSPYYMVDATPMYIDGVLKLINRETGFRIIDGIELDDEGREMAVWILKEAIEVPLAMTADQIERVPMVDPDTGLPLCLHVYRPTRPAQYRGVPLLASVIEQLYLQSAYLQAEQNASALQASLYGFITSQNPARDDTMPELPSRLDELVPVSDDTSDEPEQTPDFDVIYRGQEAAHEARAGIYAPHAKPVSSGRFMHLAEGEDIKFLQSTSPNNNFAAFFSATTEIIASAIGLPAEVLKLSFNSSYSASRAALLQASQKFDQVRSHFVEKFIRPVIEVYAYHYFADTFSEETCAYVAKALAVEAEFRTPRLPSIDPRQELEAWKLALELGLVTRDDVAMAMYSRKAPENPNQIIQNAVDNL